MTLRGHLLALALLAAAHTLWIVAAPLSWVMVNGALFAAALGFELHALIRVARSGLPAPLPAARLLEGPYRRRLFAIVAPVPRVLRFGGGR